MASRATGVEKGHRSHPHKTKKRLEVKRQMLAEKRTRKRSN